MSGLPLGVALVAGVIFRVNGVPTTPTPAPVISAAYYGNGALLSPIPAVGSPSSAGRYDIQVFSAAQTAVIAGTYMALIHTDDATVDEKDILMWWVNVGQSDVNSFSGTALDLLEEIRISVGSGETVNPIPVASTGATTLVRGSDYVIKPLIYTLQGLPAPLIVNDPAYWRGTSQRRINGENVLVISGTCTGINEMTFSITLEDIAQLKNGNFSLRSTISGDDITTPNNSLTILESVGS